MTVLRYMSASVGARHLQPGVWFWPSFSHSRLDAPGPMADLALGDQREQPLVVLRRRQPSRQPLRPELHRVLEAQAARVHVGIAGGLRHEQSNHVVGQQMDPQLLLVHLGRLAAQHVHARGGLEVAQVELDVPSVPVQHREIILADPSTSYRQADVQISANALEPQKRASTAAVACACG